MLTGEKRSDLAGASVAAAGDVNGDGRADVLVGAPLADPLGRRDAGSAYVVFGGTRGRVRLGALGARGFRIDGAVPRPRTFHPGANPLSSGAGDVVAAAGDVNGDGLADVLVSGRTADDALLPSAVFVVFGKRDTAPVDLASLGAGGFAIRGDGDFVAVVAGRAAGDVNGDGLADIAASRSGSTATRMRAPWRSSSARPTAPPSTSPPAASIRRPGASGSSGGTSGMLLGSTDGSGAAVAAAGDVNGDGLGDVLLGAAGARRANGKTYGSGTVFVLYGTRTPRQVTLRPGQRFGGFAVALRAGVGASAPRSPGSAGVRRRRSGQPVRPPAGSRRSLGGTRARRPPAARRGPAGRRALGLRVDVPGDIRGDRRQDVLIVGRGTGERGAAHCCSRRADGAWRPTPGCATAARPAAPPRGRGTSAEAAARTSSSDRPAPARPTCCSRASGERRRHGDPDDREPRPAACRRPGGALPRPVSQPDEFQGRRYRRGDPGVVRLRRRAAVRADRPALGEGPAHAPRPACVVAPCRPSGKLRREPLPAHAEVLTAIPDLERVQRLLIGRYKISYRLMMGIYRLGRRLRGRSSVADGAALAISRRRMK